MGHAKIFPQDMKGKKREKEVEKTACYVSRRKKEKDRRESFISHFSSYMISSPQKHVGDNLSCQLQMEKRKDKRFRLERVIRHWKSSNETMRFLQPLGFYMPCMHLLVEFTQLLIDLAFCLLTLQNVGFEM